MGKSMIIAPRYSVEQLDANLVDLASTLMFKIPEEVREDLVLLGNALHVTDMDTLCAYFLHGVDCCNVADENELIESFVTNAFKDVQADVTWFRRFDGKVAKYWDDTYLSDKQEELLFDIAKVLCKSLETSVKPELDHWLDCGLRFRFGADNDTLPILILTSKRESK